MYRYTALFLLLLLAPMGLLASCVGEERSPRESQPAVLPAHSAVGHHSAYPTKLAHPATPPSPPAMAPSPSSRLVSPSRSAPHGTKMALKSATTQLPRRPRPPQEHPVYGRKVPRGFLLKRNSTKPESALRKEYLYVRSRSLGKRLPVRLFLPPSYETSPQRYYPFVLLLGGNHFVQFGPLSSIRYWDRIFNIGRKYSALLAGNLIQEIHKTFDRSHAAEWLKRLKAGPPEEFVVVLPHTTSNGNLPNYKKYLLQELLPFLFQHYRLHPHPKLAGIDGISLGASQGFLIALNHLDLFQTLGGIQPATKSMGPSLRALFRKRAPFLRNKGIPINLSTGQWDITRTSTLAFHKFLKGLKLKVHFHDYPGGHDYYFYQGVGLLDLLLYYGYRFREHHHLLYGRGFPFGVGSRATSLPSPVQHLHPKNYREVGHKRSVVLMSEYRPTITLYDKVTLKKGTMIPTFTSPLTQVPSGTYAERLRSLRLGYLRNSVAEQVRLQSGVKGWVPLHHVGLPGVVRRPEFRRRTVRLYATSSPQAQVQKNCAVGTPLYINARDILNLYKFSECDQQFMRVLTTTGQFGYMECSWLAPVKTTFKR